MELVYWAGAKAVAGATSEIWPVDTVGAALRAAAEQRRQERFDRLLQVCTVLVDGVVVHPADFEKVRQCPVRVEILPPFAGGEEVSC
ncbi:MAG: MoaD/ThiS family protein [Microlunatus sp.]